MVFQRCSDVRVSGGARHSRYRKPQECSFSSVSEQPRRANLRGTRGLLTTIRRGEWALSIDHLGDLSIASSAAANASHEFVRMESVANPEFQADLWRSPDLHRQDAPALMLKKYHV
jgi:hypothetical protein